MRSLGLYVFPVGLMVLFTSCGEPPTRGEAEADVVVTPGDVTPKLLWISEATAIAHKQRQLSYQEYKPGETKEPVDLEGVPPYPGSSGAVYVVHDRDLFCLDQKDGKERWRAGVAPLELQVYEWQGYVAVYEETGRFQLLRAADGTRVCPEMTTHPDGIMNSSNEVIFIYGDMFLEAYDIRNGRKLWQRTYVPGEDVAPFLLSFHARGGAAIVELYSAEKGRTELMAIDPRTGQNPWIRLGKVLALDGQRVYLYKTNGHEVWVRSTGTGDLIGKDRQLMIRKLEQFNGLFFHVEGDDAVYSSDQRFFDPESAEISKGGVQPKPPGVFVATEIVRQSIETGKIKWHIGVEQGAKALKWSASDGLLFEAGGETSSRGKVFHTLKAYRLTDAARLWQIQSKTGFTYFSVHDNKLFFTTLDGWLHAYQLNP